MKRYLGIFGCGLGAAALAYFSISAGDSYWLYLIGAALLGVAAGLIRTWPDKQDE
jgi:hypothetical protein